MEWKPVQRFDFGSRFAYKALWRMNRDIAPMIEIAIANKRREKRRWNEREREEFTEHAIAIDLAYYMKKWKKRRRKEQKKARWPKIQWLKRNEKKELVLE